MKTQEFISRLDGVRKTGKDSWIARCPAHNDKSPSLSVREVEDRVLIHCFAGCDVHSVIASVGMEILDLFPERQEPHAPIKRRFLPQDAIQCLSGETFFVLMCAKSLADGEPLNERDISRLQVANRRFANAAKAVGI